MFTNIFGITSLVPGSGEMKVNPCARNSLGLNSEVSSESPVRPVRPSLKLWTQITSKEKRSPLVNSRISLKLTQILYKTVQINKIKFCSIKKLGSNPWSWFISTINGPSITGCWMRATYQWKSWSGDWELVEPVEPAEPLVQPNSQGRQITANSFSKQLKVFCYIWDLFL